MLMCLPSLGGQPDPGEGASSPLPEPRREQDLKTPRDEGDTGTGNAQHVPAAAHTAWALGSAARKPPGPTLAVTPKRRLAPCGRVPPPASRASASRAPKNPAPERHRPRRGDGHRAACREP